MTSAPVPWSRRAAPPLTFAILGAIAGSLAVIDKLHGLVQAPLPLLTLAYASLAGWVLWGYRMGFPNGRERQYYLSPYVALLLFLALSSGYVLAWRYGVSDPTPLALTEVVATGDALLEEGRKGEALVVYQAGLKRFPNSYALLMAMGSATYRLGDFDRARGYFERALREAPPDQRWKSLNDLGQTWWKLGDPRAALGFYEQASRAGIPSHARLEWQYRVAWAAFDAGDYDAAIFNYELVAAAGQKYAAASHWNMACARAQKMRSAGTGTERRSLARAAVADLRNAWRSSETRDEREFVFGGLLGGPDERDPELGPLLPTAEFKAFLREFRAQYGGSAGTGSGR